MTVQAQHIYHKTEAGHNELKSRTGAADAYARTVLILSNGKLTVAEMVEKLGPRTLDSLRLLIGLGFIELTQAPIREDVVRQPFAPVVSNTVKGAHPTPTELDQPKVAVENLTSIVDANQIARWDNIRRKAILRLSPHFGSGNDLRTVMAPLMTANTEKSFQAALDALETKVSLYQGRKAAAKLFEGLRI